ncbi:VOC family protein [Pararhizobium antarcticum]|uniref:Glyoxalase n=1 Tax=Pararhizobium antarcticum TaxID=1798805 RepID=A0A657LZ73_9HYPH|nr:VOC family protein [Pararhizobium antarcticum]OJF96635.1 glyoxalase [Rhizobium sp. 58]OJG01358.1 glyoxalase [Pararhizobium antarcticum]
MKMIFVNLPVKDLEKSRAFFGALGYSFNADFSDETAACMIVSESIFVMLLTHPKFKDFITGEISDAHKATEVLTALTADSRAEVDDILAKALAAGASPWKPNLDLGFMYSCSFQDLDGHVWEYFHMAQPGG